MGLLAKKNNAVSPGDLLYKTALGCIGTDASPNDVAPDDLACAETVNEIYKKAFGTYISTPGLSTYSLYSAMRLSPYFYKVDEEYEPVLPGDIIISPTGFGTGSLTHGHVGIMAPGGFVMSNDSYSGMFQKNYSIERWRERYGKIGGFPILFFRPI